MFTKKLVPSLIVLALLAVYGPVAVSAQGATLTTTNVDDTAITNTTLTNTPSTDTVSTDVRKTQEDLKAETAARQAATEAERADRVRNLEEKKTTRTTNIEERKVEQQTKIEDRKVERQTKIEERKAERIEKQLERVRAYLLRTTGRLEAATERLSKLSERISSRILKFEERDIDMSNAGRPLKIAKGSISDARLAIGNIGVWAANLATNISSSNDPRESFKSLRENIKEVVGTIKAAHRALVDTIVSIKASAENVRQNREDSSNAASGDTGTGDTQE